MTISVTLFHVPNATREKMRVIVLLALAAVATAQSDCFTNPKQEVSKAPLQIRGLKTAPHATVRGKR